MVSSQSIFEYSTNLTWFDAIISGISKISDDMNHSIGDLRLMINMFQIHQFNHFFPILPIAYLDWCKQMVNFKKNVLPLFELFYLCVRVKQELIKFYKPHWCHSGVQ